MQIQLENIGKRFNDDWIFSNINLSLESGQSYAIVGSNGSGKSTLMQVIAGKIQQSQGTLHYFKDGKVIPPDKIFRFLSLAAPYQELIEEFTLSQHLDFHRRFKSIRDNKSNKQIQSLLGAKFTLNKPVRNYSSGMKQRLKLALAILSETSLLLLDEPVTNLDDEGIAWYQQLLQENDWQRLTVICSNRHDEEYRICKHFIEVEDYKR
ncbi:MAG: ABC transporter ATP-binding protein [Lentimicrobiaceae bacterium]|jgi:ABC-type multidrug transport system ATPase subunit|nr:ABC transporter ATP-binding protein [Lentimicrobiaceae bacterium]